MTSRSCAVIIPTFNSAATLARALDSVRLQTAKPSEVFVCDDGSNDWDLTRGICDSFAGTLHLTAIRMPINRGAAAARNTAIEAARSDFVAFLDSDDEWHPNKLEIQYDLLKKSGLSFSAHRYAADISNDPIAFRSQVIPHPRHKIIGTRRFLFRGGLLTPTIMIRRTSVIPFDTSFSRAEDWKCWIQSMRRSEDSCLWIDAYFAAGYKNYFGQSGLSQDMNAMHTSVHEAINAMYREGDISRSERKLSHFAEKIKFPLRKIRAQIAFKL